MGKRGMKNKIVYAIVAVAFVGGIFATAYAGPVLTTITFEGLTIFKENVQMDKELIVDGFSTLNKNLILVKSDIFCTIDGFDVTPCISGGLIYPDSIGFIEIGTDTLGEIGLDCADNQVARKVGFGWVCSSISIAQGAIIVDSIGDTGQYTSLAIVNGKPALSHRDSSGDLVYMQARNIDGTSWNTVTVDRTSNSLYTSLAIVNGNPAISYYDVNNGDLKYVQASDVDGTSWNTPVTVDSTDVTGAFTSLTVVNGKPAISYYDITNQNLRYVQSSDADGATWPTPITVDSAGTTGLYTSLAIVNGKPAISYQDSTPNDDLRYVQASDVDGTSWNTPVTVDSTDNTGQHTSLAVVNGKPAISYFDQTNFNLRYVRASDVDGTSWNTPVTVDSPSRQYTSLVVVNGKPAISYRNGLSDIGFVQASDVDGTSWNTPVSVDSTGNSGQYNSLTVVNGKPAISYHDEFNGDLKYVRASDADGTEWSFGIFFD